MKKFIFLILSFLMFTDTVQACDQVRCYYATSCTVDFCLWTLDATVGAVKNESAAHAAGDTYIMKDEGAEANTTNGFTDEGSCYSIVLTATEMTAARALLNIEDQGTKTWADACVNIQTIARTASDNGSAYFAFPGTDLKSIDGQLTAANNATLNLKQLNIVNTAGDAVVATSSGSNGNGFNITGNGSGNGILTTGGSTGHGAHFVGGSSNGNAIRGTNTAGTAVNFISSGGNGVGFNATGNGTGAGIASTGGATADAVKLNGGATSGDAIHTTVVSGDGFDGSINGNIGGSMSGSVGSVTAMGAGSIDAASIAPDAIGASELASDAAAEIGTQVWATTTRQLTGTQSYNLTGNITGSLSGSVGSVTGAVGTVNALAANSIDSSVIAANAIGSSEIAAGAIGASQIAADAIGASELAADAVTEIATAVGSVSLGAGAITSATFANGAITANAIASDAITAAKIAPDSIGASELGGDAAIEIVAALLGTTASSYNVPGTVGAAINTGGSGSGGGGGTDEITSGTAQSATLTTLRMASSETFADHALKDNTAVVITDAATGKGQVRCIKDNVGSSDTVVLAPNDYWNITPTATVSVPMTYSIRAEPNCNPAKWFATH